MKKPEFRTEKYHLVCCLAYITCNMYIIIYIKLLFVNVRFVAVVGVDLYDLECVEVGDVEVGHLV